MRRRFVLGGVVAAAVVEGLIVLGRFEGRRAVATQQRGLLAVRAAVGDRLLHPQQAIYDAGGALECLTYPAAHNLFGLELCFDGSGRLVESVDRRNGEQISSFRWGPQHTPFTISLKDLRRAANSVEPGNQLDGLVP